MPDSQRRPTVLVIDDQLASKDKFGDEIRKGNVIKTITAVAKALGYDAQQQEQILTSVRFFDQYDESDGEKPAQECAKHYLETRNGDTEVPILAFVDNTFCNSRTRHENEHGEQISGLLRAEAEKRDEIPPACAWIGGIPSAWRDSRGTRIPDGIILASKNALERGVDGMPPEAILALTKPLRAGSRTENEQIIVHALRDAFERIAGPPAQGQWRAALPPPGGIPYRG